MPRTEKYNNQGVFRPDLAQTVPLATPLTLTDGRSDQVGAERAASRSAGSAEIRAT